MNGAQDLDWIEMAAAVILLAIPLAVAAAFRLGLAREIVIAAGRMILQLGLAGIYLGFLFRWNNPWLTLTWLAVMIAVAASSACRHSDLRLRRMLPPTLLATGIATVGVVIYFDAFIVPVAGLLDARYLVVVGGMLLGNTMSGNIIALTHFFGAAREETGVYEYRLACGATREEALRPVYREALRRALRPTIASMMTIGLVSLPGMMTGQILGGSSPMVAIKYQIAIMLAILAVLALGVALVLRFAAGAGFDRWGRVRPDVFKARSGE